MPTALPSRRSAPSWRECRRLVVLIVRMRWLSWRMGRLGSTAPPGVLLDGARRWLVMSAELHGLLGSREPEGVARTRAVLSRPLPDGSTLLEPPGAARSRP